MKAVHAILLGEDNPADVEIARRALRETGEAVELIVVRDGQEALDYLLRRDRPAGAWRLARPRPDPARPEYVASERPGGAPPCPGRRRPGPRPGHRAVADIRRTPTPTGPAIG
jgi:hypothetical protein